MAAWVAAIAAAAAAVGVATSQVVRLTAAAQQLADTVKGLAAWREQHENEHRERGRHEYPR